MHLTPIYRGAMYIRWPVIVSSTSALREGPGRCPWDVPGQEQLSPPQQHPLRITAIAERAYRSRTTSWIRSDITPIRRSADRVEGDVFGRLGGGPG